MQPFQLTLANNATLTGIRNLPPTTSTSPKHRPLIVGLHGGSYCSSYFDADARHTAANPSNALGVPFVAIDRPCYGGSSSLYPLPADANSFPEAYGLWLHKYILPAVWTAFGADCSCVVLLCHSLGATGAIIAAFMHAAESVKEGPAYPLGGLIISGFGSTPGNHVKKLDSPDPPPKEVVFPTETKDALMLPPGTADPAVYAQGERLNQPMPFDERASLFQVWLPDSWRRWAAGVRCAVMIGIAERDTLWAGTEAHAREFGARFGAAVRVDAGVIRGAPHCIELSYWSAGWYARCFGFALECAASHAVGDEAGGAEEGK